MGCRFKADSTAHTHMSKMEDEKFMVRKLTETKLFKYQPGRKSKTFPQISKCLLEEADPVALDKWLKKRKKRLAQNPHVECESALEDEDEDDDSETEVNEFELIDEDDEV